MNITLDFGDTLELTPGMKLRLRVPLLTDEQILRISSLNEIWRIEREPSGELSFELLKCFSDSIRMTELHGQLHKWNQTNAEERGCVFGSNVGVTLPNGALRSPIAAWLTHEQWNKLQQENPEGFITLSPHFIAEMRTLNLRLDELDVKMREYQKAGVRLGLLFDLQERVVYAYRSNGQIDILTKPTHVSCEPEMPGFIIDTEVIFATNPLHTQNNQHK